MDQFIADHFTVIAVGWYDESSNDLSFIPPNITLGEN